MEGSDSSHLWGVERGQGQGGAEIQCKWNIPQITILGLILGLLSTQTDCSLVANQNQLESVMHKFIL